MYNKFKKGLIGNNAYLNWKTYNKKVVGAYAYRRVDNTMDDKEYLKDMDKHLQLELLQRGQMQITEKQLQHMVNFLTHKANYKVGLFLDEDEDGGFNINTTLELIENAKHLIDTFYKKGLTYAEAMESVVNYRYDDDCINEGVAEMWKDYCKENNIWQ